MTNKYCIPDEQRLMALVEEPCVQKIPTSDMKGDIDIDSIVLCGKSMNFFKPDLETLISYNPTSYFNMKNVKMFKPLNDYLRKLMLFKRSAMYVEFPIANYSNQQIYCILAVDSDLADRTNYAKAFAKNVVQPTF